MPWVLDPVTLRRCGATTHPPLCDGSHDRVPSSGGAALTPPGAGASLAEAPAVIREGWLRRVPED